MPIDVDSQIDSYPDLPSPTLTSRQEYHRQLAADLSSLNSSLQDIHMSTRPIIFEDETQTHDLKVRTTAKKYRGYQVPEPQQHVPSSVVRRSFPEFDYDGKIDIMEDNSLSLELPRGLSTRGDPRVPTSKLRNAMGAGELDADALDSSLYNVTPRQTTKAAIRRGLGVERGNLNRKENVNVRRTPSTKMERQQQSHSDPYSRRGERNISGTHSAGFTRHSFAEDGSGSFQIPNNTEFYDMMHNELADSPLRPRKHRYSSNPPAPGRQPPFHSKNFLHIEGVPIPEDEQRIIKQLTLLQDKIENLERDKSELEEKNDEQQRQIFELRAQLEAAAHARRSDSALGSSNEGDTSTGQISGKTHAKLEVIRLNAMVTNLQSKLSAAERSKSVAERTAKRVQDERAKHISTSGPEASALRVENEQLRAENDVLRSTIDELNQKVSLLEAELDDTHQRHYQVETDLRDRLVDNDADLLAENHTLHDQLAKLKIAYQKESGKIHQEAQSRRAAEAAAKAEYSKLQGENEILQKALREAREKRELELRRWEARELQLRAQLAPGDRNAQKKVNVELGKYNEELKVELAKIEDEIKKGAASNRRGSESAGAGAASRSRSRSRTREVVVLEDDGVLDASDADSTTNISILLRKARKNSTAASQHQRSSSVQAPIIQQLTEADTFLDIPAEEVLANVRMNIEQEHRAKKSAAASAASKQASGAEEPSVSRKSSLKKDHARQGSRNGAVIEDEQLQHSIRVKDAEELAATGANSVPYSRRIPSTPSTNNHARKRSAAPDVTSAILIPDFTLHPSSSGMHLGTNKQSGSLPHDTKKCTVCRRILLSQDPQLADQLADLSIHAPIPISQRPEYAIDIDATPRPSEPPLRALYRLIQSVGDEIVHLKIELRAAERRVEMQDPSKGKRERERLHRELEKVNRALEAKEAEMYALYDVLEGYKGKNDAGVSEQEVDREEERFEKDDTVTEEVKEIVRELRATNAAGISGKGRGRRVTIMEPGDEDNTTGLLKRVGEMGNANNAGFTSEEFSDGEEDDDEDEDEEDGQTDTWRGFPDQTESLRLGSNVAGGGNARRVW